MVEITVTKSYSILRDVDNNALLRVKYSPDKNQHYIGETINGATVASVVADETTITRTITRPPTFTELVNQVEEQKKLIEALTTRVTALEEASNVT